MKIAIVHDWIVSYAGAERVLEEILKVFPSADLFLAANYCRPGEAPFLEQRTYRTSCAQKLPFGRQLYQKYLPLMAYAIEQLDVSAYDIVLSSSHAVSKGVLTGPNQLHVCFCYTPLRYAWDLQNQYLTEAGLTSGMRSACARMLLHYMRIWDSRTANGVDQFVAISEYIARRIKKVYGRPSKVIYPPVDVDYFVPDRRREDFYVTASRLAPYKKVNVIVDAFRQMPDRRLVVIGDGPQLKELRKECPRNVELMGHQTSAVLREHLQCARAFLFAAEEDFGIAPLEAQACGTPVIAFGRGGAVETTVPGRTGVFFREQVPGAIMEAIGEFEEIEQNFSRGEIRRNAERFSAVRFRSALGQFVRDAYLVHTGNLVKGASVPKAEEEAAFLRSEQIVWR